MKSVIGKIPDIIVLVLYFAGIYILWITMWPVIGAVVPWVCLLLLLLAAVVIQDKYFKKAPKQ